MGTELCTCLNNDNEYNSSSLYSNETETQVCNTKILYVNSLVSVKSNRQKKLDNSINYTNYATTINVIPTKQEFSSNFSYLDCDTLTKYLDNIKLINKIKAIFRGISYRKKYNNEILDKLISFEQNLLLKYKQKVIRNNPNLEKCINKYSDIIMNYPNIKQKYYSEKKSKKLTTSKESLNYGMKLMKYKKQKNNFKYINGTIYDIDENDRNHLTQMSPEKEIDYLINNAQYFYEGESIGKKKNGFGILLKSDGEKMVGTWDKDDFSGWNYIIDKEGTLHIGMFNHGILNGKGEKYNLNGKIYMGDFVNNVPDGEGKEINDEYIYEGEFKCGRKEGKGKISYKNNDWYEGEFENDKFNGNGHYYWGNNGYEYYGNYLNDEIEGNGVFKYGDKAIYKGEFHNGVKDGFGELITNNVKIKGNFKNDLPEGLGYIEDKKGFKGYVQFREGKIIENN